MKLSKKISETLKDKNLYIFLIITLLFFGIFVKMDFATDTYAVIGNDKSEILSNFLQSGRFITAVFFAIFTKLNIKIQLVYILSFLLSIISISLSMYKLNKMLLNEKVSKASSIIISILLIINPFSIEEMMYIEKGIMTLAILLVVLAVEQFVKYIKNEDKKYIISSAIFMLISIMCYQGIAGLFVIITSVFAICESKTFKKFIKNLIALILIYGIAALINLLVIKLLSTSSRVDGQIIILESIKKILSGSKNMIQTYNILPKMCFIIFNVLTAMLTVFACVKNEKGMSNVIKTILQIIYIILCTYIFSILPQAMQKTESIWFVSRSTYPFASMLGAIMLFKALKNDINLNKIFIIIGISFLCIELVRFYQIEIDHYNVNYIDKVISESIGQEIENYENETGIKVTKISIYKDKNPRFSYNNIFVTGDINITAFATSWSDVNAINYYNNLKLRKVENDENIKKEFENVDYTFWSEKQIKIINDTLHLCIF